MRAIQNKVTAEKTIFYGFLLLLIAVPLLYLPNMFDRVLIKDAVYYFFVALLLLAWSFMSRKQGIVIDKKLSLILIFFGLVILSTFRSIQLSTSVIGVFRNWEGLATYSVLALTYFLAIQINWTDRKIKALMNVLILTAALVSVLGLQKFLGTQERINFTFLSPNAFSFFLMIAWPITLRLLFWSKGSRSEKFFYGISAALIFAANIVTFSRTGWLTSIVLFFLVMVTHPDRKKFLKMLAPLAILILVVAIYNANQVNSKVNLEDRLASIFTSDAIQSRVSLWKAAAKLTRDRPLTGYGPDTFALAYPRHETIALAQFTGRPRTPHNYALNIAANLGVPAMVVLFLVFFLSIKEGYLSGNYLRRSLSISLIGFMILSLSLEWHGGLKFPFWLFIGVISGRKVKFTKHLGLIRVALALLAAALFVWVGMITLSDYYFKKDLYVKNTPARESYIIKAIAINPYVYNYWDGYPAAVPRLSFSERLAIIRQARKHHPLREELLIKEVALTLEYKPYKSVGSPDSDEREQARLRELTGLLVLANKAIKLRPLSGKARLVKAKLLIRLGRGSEAAAELERFINIKSFGSKNKRTARKLLMLIHRKQLL